MKKSAPRGGSDARGRARYSWSLLAAASVAGLVVARATVPAWSQALPKCTFRQWSGLHCPGCGGTRSTLRLLDGDLPGALSMNPAVVLFAAASVAVVATGVWREWKGGDPRVFPPWLAWSLAGFVVVFGLVRNLPWWPFTLLVPQG